MIDVFYHIRKICDNSILVLVGDGEEKEKILKRIEEYGINDSVLFLGMRKDVSDLLNMFDVFFLPSRFEGLPVSLIEAQCNGLPCYTSSSVTTEVNFENKIRYLSLGDSPENWAECMLNSKNERYECDMLKYGYSIEEEALKLKDKYIELINYEK